ncbi:MAG: hypothetical protein AB8C13_06725 [Phycisphaerales bacterium]
MRDGTNMNIDSSSEMDSGAGHVGLLRKQSMDSAISIAMNGGQGALATPQLRSLICPFCGELTADTGRCQQCSARFDPLSRQASQNAMGPWFVRDGAMPFRPGCNYSTIQRLAGNGGLELNSVLRGPSTHQFWMLARHTPGVSHLLGMCHNCGLDVDPGSFSCTGCHEVFSVDRDRQHIGLGPARPLPGTASVELLALRAEPAAGADQVSGPAAIPVGAPKHSGGSSATSAHGAALSHGQEAVSGDGVGDLDSLRKIDELDRAVRSLNQAWRVERTRGWMAVGFAGAITVLAIMIILMT